MTTLLTVLCIFLSIALLAALLTLRRVHGSIPEMIDEEVTTALTEFKKRSGRTRVGTTVEQLVPFMKEFPYDPSDVRILSGGPVDYAVFDGLCEGQVRELVFLDVKTGAASTNKAQRQVEECAFRGLVRFALFEVDPAGAVAHPRRRTDEPFDLKRGGSGAMRTE